MLTLWVPGVFLIICSRGPEIHLCFLQNFADKTTDGKIRFSISFLVSFELFFQELFFGHKECFIQPNLPRAFSRWKNARRASHVYIRGWAHRGTTENTYIYVVGGERVKNPTLWWSVQGCPSLNFSLEPEPSFFGFVFLGEPEPELFWFSFFGGARARAFFVLSFWGSRSQSWQSLRGQAWVGAEF